MIEVWETKDQYDRYNREIVWPLVARLSEGHPAPAQEPSTHEFDVRGLVVPQGGIAR